MKKKLGILEEVTYSYKLMQRFNQSEKSFFLVYSFSEVENLEKFLEKETLDILLVGEDYFDNILNTDSIGKIIFLQEDKLRCKGDNSIFKYQAAADILRQLNSIVNKTIGNSNQEELPVKIFGVYSPVGRCGKTSFSLALAKKISREREVLYLNLKPFSMNDAAYSDEALSLADVFYYLEQDNANEEILDKAIVEENGLKFIYPMESPLDLQEVKEEKWNDFFMKLNNGRYADVIVVIFDETVSCFIQLFEMCEKIYIPVLEETAALQKIKCFDKFIHRCLSESVEEKICRLQIPILNIEELGRFEQIINHIIEEISEDG